MPILYLAGQPVNITITYSRRRTITLEVCGPQQVKITAPKGVSQDYLLNLAQEKSPWITEKLRLIARRAYLPGSISLAEPTHLLFQGKPYLLQIKQSSRTERLQGQVLLEKELIVFTQDLDQTMIQKILKQWYCKQLQGILHERLSYFQRILPVTYNQVKITSPRKRWASCSSKGNLLFNWRLAMLPQSLLDYIVVHEMAHLVHLNHSTAFWQTVASVLPDYQERKQQLNDNFDIGEDW